MPSDCPHKPQVLSPRDNVKNSRGYRFNSLADMKMLSGLTVRLIPPFPRLNYHRDSFIKKNCFSSLPPCFWLKEGSYRGEDSRMIPLKREELPIIPARTRRVRKKAYIHVQTHVHRLHATVRRLFVG